MSIALLTHKVDALQEKTNFLEQQLSLEQDRNSRLIETLQNQTRHLLPLAENLKKPFWKKWID